MFQIVELLLVFQFLQSSDGRLHCEGRSGVVGPGTTSDCFHAGATVPGPNGSPLHLGFAREGASELGVLADLNFLHHFPEGGAITGAIFTDNSDFLGAFSHFSTKEVGPQEHKELTFNRKPLFVMICEYSTDYPCVGSSKSLAFSWLQTRHWLPSSWWYMEIYIFKHHFLQGILKIRPVWWNHRYTYSLDSL